MGPDMLKEAEDHQRASEARLDRDIELLAQLRAHPDLHTFVGYLEEGDLNGPSTAECCAVVLQLLRGSP